MSISIRDIIEAERAIRPYIRTTPVMEVDPADFGLNWRGRMTLKLECMQHTGSFKPRGAFASLLLPERETRAIAAASGGNHGAAVAHAAKTLGLKATIFVPEISSPAKIAKIRATGCDLRIGGANYAEALAACQAFQAESGARDIHAYDAPLTVTGQGTLGLEWAAQSHDMTHVLIAIGGGGLISGVGAAFYAGPSVIGVEPEGSRAAQAARAAGEPVKVDVKSVAADSLGASSIGGLNHELIDSHVDQLLLVEDDAIRAAQKALWQSCGIASEPGGAAAMAALMSGRFMPPQGAHVGVLVCGANVDPATLSA
ncbi:MAG: serine/threonine dehydratase [Pikeienuella sp.]